MKQNNHSSKKISGFTIRSVVVGIFAMLVTALLIDFVAMFDSWNDKFGTEALPMSAIIAFLMVSLPAAGVYALGRFRVLNRAEMLCILYALLIGAPLMARGFWRYMLGTSAGIAHEGHFDKLDAFSDKLWPHGPNLVDKILENPNSTDVITSGNVKWEAVDIDENKNVTAPRLINMQDNEKSWVRIKIPQKKNDKIHAYPGQPYMITMLARARGLSPQSNYYCRILYDNDKKTAKEAFISTEKEKRTFLHKTGFVRVGRYGFELSPQPHDTIVMEIGLSGRGAVDFYDLQFMNVATIDAAYNGRQYVTPEEYESLPPYERSKYIVKPNRMMSLEGVKFILSGYTPMGAWAKPVFAWAAFLLLFVIAMFGIGVILRRQWVQNERYPLPLAQVPIALLGEEKRDDALPPIWRNRFMWLGFGLALFWSLMRVAHTFNTSVPDMSVNISLGSYFTGAGWGATWQGVNFTISALFLGIGLFMELNVLISLVVGYFLFRFQYWFGEANGLTADQNYPYGGSQTVGAFLAYAAVILFLIRKYLWKVTKEAVAPRQQSEEILSYRIAFLMVIASFIGILFWAKWLDTGIVGIVLFFATLLAVAIVAMKIRAECGTPGTSFIGVGAGTGSGFLLVFPLLGGLSAFGARGMVIAAFAFALLSQSFFIVSGMQFELIELGRRFKMKGSHILLSSLFGIVGAIVIGGWVYFSGLYSVGASNLTRNEYGSKVSVLSQYNKEMAKANERLVKVNATGTTTSSAIDENQSDKFKPEHIALLFGGIVTIALTVLRQVFAGFWFHPVGFIVGATGMLGSAWGSLLMAWAIRFGVLKFGGAATVREKLLPAATGIILGTAAAYLVTIFVNGHVFFFNNGGTEFINQAF